MFGESIPRLLGPTTSFSPPTRDVFKCTAFSHCSLRGIAVEILSAGNGRGWLPKILLVKISVGIAPAVGAMEALEIELAESGF